VAIVSSYKDVIRNLKVEPPLSLSEIITSEEVDRIADALQNDYKRAAVVIYNLDQCVNRIIATHNAIINLLLPAALATITLSVTVATIVSRLIH